MINFSRRTSFILFSFLCLQHSFAQIVPDYIPFDYSCKQTNQFWLNEQTLTKNQIANFDIAYKKEVTRIFNGRDSTLRKDCANKSFITDTAFCSYYTNLFNYLIAANNLPTNEMQLLISRENWPNASSIGNGVVLLNIGLIPHLENEAQLAFILCHEIAHFKMDHSIKQLDAYFKKKYDKELVKQLGAITKNEFGQNRAALKLLTNVTYDTHRHGREKEMEADSLGIVYLSHTAFDLNASVRTMQILDSVDHESDSLVYTEIFKSEEYPFQPFWIKKQKIMGFSAKDESMNSDSLKTHPDCLKRANFLQLFIANKMPSQQGKKNFFQPENKFIWLKTKVSYEIVVGLYDAQHYDYSLFHALLFAKQHPADPFGICMAAKSLHEMHQLYANHTLMDFIHSPNPNYSENYNQLLRMLSKMGLNDYEMVNKQFVKKNHSLFNSSTTFTSLEQQINP